ncbi:class I SAM-dependent methyltransferase [Actinosynnema pretiosum subsp. pretiosum]|uniref:Class I SAM-dependent methyltransferase n=1 Tax=Actinosynnema pretiosum subsp. pretiosum TaxID=103721 RepID=A0AA45R4L9_9PSEU|nr:Methyltransferase type 11 [Actinosynnema pretiosum subsp. pretiosum]QUF04909.1 class I SAM-dependent methyltransferase [Actinosynnema pretiosum subsp. pretiosum]
MDHEDPRAYLLGLEGLALLRAYAGEHDREFTQARIAEVRALLADDSLAGAGVDIERVDAVSGYRLWSPTYDSPNTSFDLDEPLVAGIVDALPPGDALDAACGTGRHAARLAGLGHRVVGVDGSPDMLARARARVPGAVFARGDLHRLPVPDASTDLVVCALALTHVPDLRPVLAEFTRVLRPGGHLVLSDVHPERVLLGSVPKVRDAAGRPGRLSAHRHRVGGYLRAALPLGLRVLGCAEPTTEPSVTGEAALGPWEGWPWSLAALVPEAARAAHAGSPALLVWHFQHEGR